VPFVSPTALPVSSLPPSAFSPILSPSFQSRFVLRVPSVLVPAALRLAVLLPEIKISKQVKVNSSK